MTQRDDLCCPPCDGLDACAPLPASFARVRYFFGKRLVVADFVDQNLYHAGKLRFHSRHLHGAGAVCGLGLTLFPGSTSVLRVGKGAAVDGCGREIVVGWDQCVDLGAWIARKRDEEKAAHPGSDWPKADLVDGKLTLAVVLRYRECPAAPEPAPRNPCSCDDGGCDYGRVREGFELDLVDPTDPAAAPPATSPAAGALSAALAKALTGGDLRTALATLVAAGCGDPTAQEWITLGTVVASLDAQFAVTGFTFGARVPPVLASTALLQELLLRALAASWEPAALLTGAPAIAAASFAKNATPPDVVALQLSGPVLGPTVTSQAFKVSALDKVAGWSALDPKDLAVSYVEAAGAPPTIRLEVKNGAFFGNGGLYRVSLQPDPGAPICDAQLRPLLPRRFAWDFATDAAGKAVPAPFQL